jgi:hypothetical protein
MLAVIVILLVALGAALFLLNTQRRSTPTAGIPAADSQSIAVFFPNERGILERKTVEVPQQLPDKARGDAIFRALKEMRCIPDRLKLYDLALGRDGVLYLNMSREFTDPPAADKEITMTYGIVDSFIDSFRGAKSVQLLVEGQPVYTRNGLLYIFEPLEFNAGVLEE